MPQDLSLGHFEQPSTASNEAVASARGLDRFYTMPEIVRDCVLLFETWTGLGLAAPAEDVIEPSAGAFLTSLPERTLA